MEIDKMKVENYDEYKDSGLAWLGKIPCSWKIIRLKNLIRAKITDGPHVTPQFIDEGIPFLSVDGIQNGELVFKNSRSISLNDHMKYQKKCRIEKFDILMGKAASIGKIAQSKVDFEYSIWSPLALIKPNLKKVNTTFMEYYLKSTYSQYQIEILCTSNTQKNISMDDIPKIILTLPPLPEQTAIAAFLDRKTALIDQAIDIKQKQIELLKERKQILIHQAVTRGLNPNVKMKYSGVEWIGEIPEGWEVLYNRRLFREKGRKITNLNELPLSLSQVDGVIPSESMKERSLSPSHRDNFKLCLPGDLIVNRFKGHLGVFFETKYRGIITFHYGVFEPEKNICSKYFELLFHTETYKTIYAGKSNGMTIGLQNLSNQNFYDVQSIVPPIDEQKDIIKHCETISEKVEAVILCKEQEIEKLKEYKATLINSAVTGKIKVC
jgi:type I restriction enzyme S subunit